MSRIVVVDDHPVFRKGLTSLLAASGHEVVGEAMTGREALQVVADTTAEVVLMDVSMPDLGGIEATERIVARDPAIRVVVITMFDDEATVAAALRAGASAFLTKQSPPAHILAAVEAAASGALWLGQNVPRPFVRPDDRASLPGLTAREADVADLLSRGLTNPEIARRLHVSVKTVANYVSIVMLKLDAADRLEAARIVRETRTPRSHEGA
ncbi:DNA-binding response regulator, NarL/FixJ family, contains REC and HTH domains [Paramicrobacterium humi]|uniref:DNA-binding response regulator, NarL/FixJ family, contains REC and HTH domains n=1 Tax=Paramicrobacterium humi TaxID=640635 RepID=A0A1H4KLS1_9MICO|nr:response regulator transcription factor [Microbacterium humi]SEB58862.1 DNA-binding response regulator, NarL/FixJ family, contains REC and HTH domains [Microbacterium humi]